MDTFEFGLGLGVGLTLAVMALAWLFRREWRRAEYHAAERVAGMVRNIIAEKMADDAPDPIRQKDVAEALLMRKAKRRKLIEELTKQDKSEDELLMHVAAGGSADDPPSQWRKLRKD